MAIASRRPLPPALRDFDRQQRERVRASLDVVRSTRRPNFGRAPIAPPPTDPTRCRWCSRRLIALIDGDPANYCQGGCQRNDLHSYLGDCRECGREFETGQPSAVLCFECDVKDSAPYAAPTDDHHDPRDRYYTRHRR